MEGCDFNENNTPSVRRKSKNGTTRPPAAYNLLQPEFKLQGETMSAYPYQQPGPPMANLDPSMVTTALELPGYKIVRSLGVVRGIVVRSRNVFATLGAGLQTILGGNITVYSQLCEKTRQDAFIMMMEHAAQHGANAVIAARYDANELMQGVTEVLAYGTAVYVEKL
jgi:uncharacterized protein YbjQ (UPF0145 family)